ncbi:hypothetical protein [Streptomyces sp. NPDC091215]|uniref:hypothetical protein n=1 Tax=Streptomyces sp. NPDC091215 TaxID=3155192 RepID=UPI003439E2C3
MTDLVSLFSGGQDFWLADLPAYQRQNVLQMLASGMTYEQVATAWLNGGVAEYTAPFGVGAGVNLYFEKVIDELHELLCVGRSYEQERNQIASGFKTGQTGLVATITAIIAPHLDSAPSFLAPAIAVLLCAISKIGLGAWCRMQAERRMQSADRHLNVTSETPPSGDVGV